MKLLKSGGQDPKEVYDMACSLMAAAEGLKEMAYAMGYDEESDMEKVSDEKQEENEDAYEKGDSHFVDQPTEGLKTYGDRIEEESEAEDASEDSEEEEDDNMKMPIGKRAILISLKKKLR